MKIDKAIFVYYHNIQMVKRLSLPDVLIFDWDPGNLEHIKKHDVNYQECEEIFYNSPTFFDDKLHSLAEDRYLAYGFSNKGRELTLVFTMRNDKMRVISARDQNKKERKVSRRK